MASFINTRKICVFMLILTRNDRKKFKKYYSTKANVNALFCYLMLMAMHYTYKQANAYTNSNATIRI